MQIRRNQRAEREEYSTLTKAELRHKIYDLINSSGLDSSVYVQRADFSGSQAKEELLKHWENGDPMTRLELQRVLRIVRELDK